MTRLALEDVRQRVKTLATDPRLTSAAMWMAWAIAFAYAFNRVFHRAIFEDWSRYGTHDWDSHIAYRYISVLSLLKYHEMPWFSPWFCHGFPAWAYVEGASNILSPYLPVYLLTPMNVAPRFEALADTAIGMVGAFFLARRFTRSFALASFVGFLFVLNGRWALQFWAGHSWHFQYAWVPWVFYLYDKSCREGSAWHAVGAGVMAGLIVTTGGIYPAPHTAVALLIYCIALMLSMRSWRPLGRAIVAGLSAFGFSAPKLVPLVLLMNRFPRLVDSGEYLSLSEFFHTLADPEKFRSRDWEWHEYGSYIGLVPVAIILLAMLLPSPRKTRVFRVLGVLFSLLGMGSFGEYSPWALLHHIPPFASQHVPSRFMLLGLLFASIDAAATFGALFDKFFHRFRRLNAFYPWFDAALLVGVVLISKPMLNVSRAVVKPTFERRMLPITPAEHFQQAQPTKDIDYDPRHGFGAILPAMFANVGSDKECHTVPTPPMGAIMKENPRYRGEAYFQEGSGQAEVVKFSPNTAEIQWHDATPGSVLTYNMNYHPGWSANDEPALDVENAVSYRVTESSGSVRFSYYPPGLNAGVAIGLLFLSVLVFARWGETIRQRIAQRLRERRERRDPQAQAPHEPAIEA